MLISVPLIFLMLSIVVMLSVKIFLLKRKLHHKNSLLVKQDKYTQTETEPLGLKIKLRKNDGNK